MPIAEFEEKQYETPANIELGLQHAAVFAPGQVLEAVVGYDAAVHPPQNAPIWRLVGAAAPAGLQLVPNLWQRATVQPKAPELPSTYVSLVFQYKRPKYLSTRNASQWHHWGAPYYRFHVLQRQQHILAHLENALSARAVLRYACPAFWAYDELQMHQAAHNVLERSTFVSATALMGHAVWTYTSPGTAGYANPRGESIPTDTIRGIWSKVKQNPRCKKENLFQHLRGLATGIRAPEIRGSNTPEWLTRFSAPDHLDMTRRQAVADTVELATRFGEAGASWCVADLESPNP